MAVRRYRCDEAVGAEGRENRTEGGSCILEACLDACVEGGASQGDRTDSVEGSNQAGEACGTLDGPGLPLPTGAAAGPTR